MKVEKVEAFVCGVCENVFRKKDDAVSCCTCNECKTKFKTSNSWNRICGHCSYGTDLREARKAVRRHQESLATATERLDRLLTEKRPEKGAPR